MIHPSDENIYVPYLRVIDFALDQLEDRNDEIVMLDAGCGHSTVLEEQYKRCSKVIGVDKDRVGLNRNQLVDKKYFADLTEIPIPDQSVDIVASAWVFEHIEDPKKLVKELNRILKPGGYFSFIAPNKDSWYAILSENMPHSLHTKAAKSFYGRDVEDTFITYYKLNTEEDIDQYLEVPKSYQKIEFIYNDDQKYIGFKTITKPLAKIWHKIVMTRPMRQERLHLIGLYKKN